MDLVPGTLLASRYRILKALRRSSADALYRAQDVLLDETVTLKVARGDTAAQQRRARRFRREARLARRVTHPGVCRVHEYVEDGSRRLLVMESIEGRDLSRLIRRRGPLPPEAAYDVALQLASGLDAIHAAGLVHGRVSARNVACGPGLRVKLMELGFAFRAGSPSRRPGAVAGVPEYLSPEQVRGEAVDARSDLYSLAIVIYETFSGVPPFGGVTPVVTRFQQMYDAPPLSGARAKRLPMRLVPILEKALAKQPEDRYASAREMGEALRRAAREVIPMAPAPGAWAAGDATLEPGAHAELPLAPRLPAKWVALAGVVAAALGGLWLGTRSSPVDVTPRPDAAARVALALPGAAPNEVAAPAVVPARASAVPVSSAPPTRRRPVQPPPAPASPAASAAAPASEAAIMSAETVQVVDLEPIPPVGGDTRDEEGAAPPAIEELRDESGLLQIGVRPWAAVTIDGRPIGETPIAPLALAPGIYTARLEHPGYRPLVRKVTVHSGETVRLQVDLGLDGIKREPVPRRER